jgi:hypothetical protein
MARRNINIINIRTKKKNIYVKSGCNYSLGKNTKKKRVVLNEESFMNSLRRYIGQTITIYTISGGASGSGFTGVLLDVCKDHIKILTGIASAPDCSLGSSCMPRDNNVIRSASKDISLGSMTEVPLDKIAAFIHNTIS